MLTPTMRELEDAKAHSRWVGQIVISIIMTLVIAVMAIGVAIYMAIIEIFFR